MRFEELHTTDAVLVEIGRRLARHRVERNLTQTETADAAGVGRATLQRMESGRSVQMTSMVKVLRQLDLLDGLDAAVPESVELPIARLEREQQRPRQRASGARSDSVDRGAVKPWTWGDEPEAGG